MKPRPTLRYLSTEHAVYGEVKLHFQVKGKVELPAGWESLVALTCFPHSAAQLGHEIKNFQTCFANDPDLVLEIMTYARQRLAELQRDGSNGNQTERVRHFLLHYPSVVREQGRLRLPRPGDVSKKTNYVDVNSLSADEIAALLMRPGLKGTTEIVKKVRQKWSNAYVNEKSKRILLEFSKGQIKGMKPAK